MHLEIKNTVLFLFAIIYCCNAHKVIRSQADAVNYIAKQKYYVNTHHRMEAEELHDIYNEVVLKPLVYLSIDNDEDVMEYIQSRIPNGLYKTKEGIAEKNVMKRSTVFTKISTKPAKKTNVTVEQTTETNITVEPTTEKNITVEPTTGTNFTMNPTTEGKNVTVEPTTGTNFTMEPTTITVTEVILEPSMCLRDLVTFGIDILGKELYALMMLDSYGRPPPGILQGNLLWLGLYDQCLNQSRDINDDEENFGSEYCLVSLVNKTKTTPFLNVGICVPDSCSVTELMELLNSNDSDIIASVVCHEEFKYSPSAIACLVFLAFLITLIILGTTVEVYYYYKQQLIKKSGFQRLESEGIQNAHDDIKTHINEPNIMVDIHKENNQGVFIRFLICFSILTNGSKILKTKQGEGSLGVLNGFRVISLWWVILGHNYVFALGLFNNPTETLDVMGRFSFQAVGNATFSVDSFFFLSGLLITYLTLKYLKNNNGNLNWLMFYVHRYLRLTPVYAIVIFFFTTLTPYITDGPLYSFAFNPNPAPGTENSLTYCQDYWWTNILYINNLYPKDITKQCLAWGWYLANDMQFFVISPFIIYLLYHYFYAGIILWVTVLLTCFGSIIGESIQRNLSTTLIINDPDTTNFLSDSIYVEPWARISTYLVGMALGYILYKYKGRVRMSPLIVMVGWMTATGIALSVVYGLYGTFHGHPLSKGATVTYITLSRFAWAVAIAWVIFACTTGHGGPVNSLLSWSAWIPLARITYCAYLLHPIIMYAVYYSLPTTIYFTDLVAVYYFIGHLVLSYAGAFVLSVCAEAPFMALEKMLLNRDKSV